MPRRALLARNVRATGYVSAPAHAVRLRGYARGVGVTVDRWRAALRARIDAVLADAPHRGIVVALAIGAQDEVSAADWLLMRGTGTSHLVAISGLHIGFVAGLAGWLAGAFWRRSGWIGRNWPLRLPAQVVAVTGGAVFAALHAALAGFNVPAQRALWMAGVVALAFVSGRNVARSAVLAWALGLVLLIDPWAVVSAGFWLSFCAVAAILFAMSGRPRVQDHRQHRDETGEGGEASSRWSRLRDRVRRRMRSTGERLRSAAHVQFAVTVALAPLTVYWFAQIPLIGPLANAFAIPWVSLLVTPAVLAGVALPAPLDAYAWHVAHALLELLAAGLQRLSGPAWALWRLPQPDAWTLAAAALGVLLVSGAAWLAAALGRAADVAAASDAGAVRAAARQFPSDGAGRRSGHLGAGRNGASHVAVRYRAGPGVDSRRRAGGRAVSTGAWRDGARHADHQSRRLRSFGRRARRAGRDRGASDGGGIGAVECAVVEREAARRRHAAVRGGPALAVGRRGVRDALAGRRSAARQAERALLRVAGQHLARSRQARRSARIQTEPSRMTALLTADIEAPVERVLLARDRGALRAQVLVVPHHGSKTSSTEPFLDSIDPLIALFQVGYRNRFHHPNAGVFERYKARQIELGRSDADGAVRVEVSPAAEANADGASKSAMLTLERYRDTQRRYWMDR